MLKNHCGTRNVGFFKIESGKVMVSDPCYERESKDHGILDNVKNGTWNAFIELSDEGSWGKRVAEFRCEHENHRLKNMWDEADFEVGVDSGQAGVFDEKYYKDDAVVKDMPNHMWNQPCDRICVEEPWYSFCCDKTLHKHYAGVIPFGAVSGSGFGDGGYECYFHKNNDGLIDAIKIVFIDDTEEDEEENN